MRHVVPVLPDSRSPVSQSLITLSAYRGGRISAAGEGEETEWLGHGVDKCLFPFGKPSVIHTLEFLRPPFNYTPHSSA